MKNILFILYLIATYIASVKLTDFLHPYTGCILSALIGYAIPFTIFFILTSSTRVYTILNRIFPS